MAVESDGNLFGEHKLCDLDFLLVNLGRNRATAERLIGIYLQNYPVLAHRLTEAASQQNRAALRDALHDIRSNCVLFSGDRCVAQARYFEGLARDDSMAVDASEWHRLAGELADCLEQMAQALRRHLDDLA